MAIVTVTVILINHSDSHIELFKINMTVHYVSLPVMIIFIILYSDMFMLMIIMIMNMILILLLLFINC